MQQLPQIPGYRIMKKLGQGGMADVYLGVQENLARKVAIKVLIPSLFRDEQFPARFVKEAQTAAHLSHPNIITIHDVNKLGDCYYIVMEYLEESLSQRMKQVGVLSPAEALNIVKMIAAALDYAHRQGIIHRDIKPDNIMFRVDGSVVLVDFGIARAMDSATHLTRTGMSIGTPHYMSPEQCRGEKIDGRSDYYSLGVQLFELLTGNVPYNAENTAGIIIKHIQEAIPRLPGHLSYWQPLIDKMLAKDRNDRFANGKELIFFIEALQHTRNGTEKMPPMPQTAPEFATVKLPRMEMPGSPRVETPKSAFSFRKATRVEPLPNKKILPVMLAVGMAVILGIALYFLFRTSPTPLPVQNDGNISQPSDQEQKVSVTPGELPAKGDEKRISTNNNGDPDKSQPVIESPVKELPPTKQPVKDQTRIDTHEDVTPRQEPQVDEGESIEKQAELDKQYTLFLQKAQHYVTLGNYDKALENVASAKNLKKTKELTELEQAIRQARERKRRKADTVTAVNSVTLLELEPELRKSYNTQLQRIQIDIPKIVAMFQVKGSVMYNLTIDQYGSVHVESLQDNLEISPPRREKSVNSIISHKLNNLMLTPPKNKMGQPTRVINWRVTFKVGKYKNFITLTKQ